ncbi:hypothetical protein [Hymenobacter properus]|uniref:Uncharacterized protein n=1 Tax=Hymenobacter properus TaxID=2791026 RepID=A0A931FHY3_9BACT|nr:hypothetical protein [Hymenobacter properus]MBF9140188.1 hypothetical protein [Hymenobacter properus]MBR7718995.1 hypothetical protein [Microvirga sp. SRT04]
MLANLFRFLRPVAFYAVLLLLPLGWFAWGTLTGTRLLGDDNESTETLGASGGGGGGRSSVGHARFYHK